jgi:hypothetical protein
VDTKQIEIELPVRGAPASLVRRIEVQWRRRGAIRWNMVQFRPDVSDAVSASGSTVYGTSSASG